MDIPEITVEYVLQENEDWFDVDKLAKAVAMHETKDCQLWYGSKYNNCFWIKNWNTAPCERIWNNKMCIYNSPEESYKAFKKIWTETWYNWPVTREKAIVWSWDDRAEDWYQNVTHFYETF